ncbi:uncharacterized protein LOC144448104 [Glandiceps talaboti]
MCVITERKCVVIQPPSPPFTCTKPDNTEARFNLSQLQGNWYIVRGLNPVYDCYACQYCQFTPNTNPDESGTYVAQVDYLVTTLTGDVRPRTVHQFVSQPNPQNPGILFFNYTDTGIIHNEEWRVLAFDDKDAYALIYYCGQANAYHYEGVLLYSRKTKVSENVLKKVGQAAKSNGYDFNKFCTAPTDNCPY